MTLYLIFYMVTVWDCPFGLAKATALRPLLCSASATKRWKLTSFPQEVAKTVQLAKDDGDADPLVIVLTGARSREAAVVWRPEIK